MLRVVQTFIVRIIYSLVTDTPTISNPYSGDPEPSRNEWTHLFSKGPTDTVVVPSDAVIGTRKIKVGIKQKSK